MTATEKIPRTEPRSKTIGDTAVLAVTNRYHRVVIVVLLVVILGLLWSNHDLSYKLGHIKVPVVQATPAGLAEVIESSEGEYKVTPRQMKWWLTKWAHDHFGRKRATLATAYPASLWMASRLKRDQLTQHANSTHWIDAFLRSTEPEVAIDVTGIFLPRSMTPPYHAVIEFTQTFESASGLPISSRTMYSTVTFYNDSSLLMNPDGTQNKEMFLNNPLAFVLTDWQQDKDFVPQS